MEAHHEVLPTVAVFVPVAPALARSSDHPPVERWVVPVPVPTAYCKVRAEEGVVEIALATNNMSSVSAIVVVTPRPVAVVPLAAPFAALTTSTGVVVSYVPAVSLKQWTL